MVTSGRRRSGLQLAMVMTAALTLGLAACGGVEPTDGVTAGADATGPQGSVQGAPAPGGGLTVSQARDSDLDGPLTVTGFLIDDGRAVLLCEVAMESYPPQCAGASLDVEGITVADLEGARREGDVAWVDQASLTGEVTDGTLQVSETTA